MRIIEIFQSLQGEGKNQGRPCVFVRLAGCNLACTWCDTPESRSGGREMSGEEVFDHVSHFNPSLVCITGGEPLLQGDELEGLLRSLHAQGIAIDIETNGTVDFNRFQPFASVCMDVKCPSSGEKSVLPLLEKIRTQDSVKFVVKDEADCQYAQQVLGAYRIAGEIFLSPVFGTDYPAITRFILMHNLPVRMQVQLHKIIGVK
jgi:7-carboxy-7-deazaguanine synthase